MKERLTNINNEFMSLKMVMIEEYKFFHNIGEYSFVDFNEVQRWFSEIAIEKEIK